MLLGCLGALVVGLIKPSLVTTGKRQTRKFVIPFYGGLSFLLIIVIGITAPASPATSPASKATPPANNTAVEASTSTPATNNSSASATSKSTSSQTNNKSQAATPPPAPATWKTVGTWSGDSMGNTQPFTVGNRWRIVWKAAPGKAGAANFVTTVMDMNGGTVDMVGNVVGSGSDTSYERGAGTYYLNITADENYTLEVQTQVSSLPKQPTYTWTTVAKLQGSSMKNTQDFKLNAPWRVVWTSAPGSIGSANFSVTINSSGSPVGQFANVMGKDHGVDYEYTSGTVNFSILADEDYAIEIQEGH